MFENPPTWPGLILWLFIALLVFYIPLRRIYNDKNIAKKSNKLIK